MGSVQTVTGAIDESELGFTLPHEHLFIDLRYYWRGEPEQLSRRAEFSQPVTLENRAEVVYNTFSFKDNLLLDDLDNTISEVQSFLGHGGCSIVDLTATQGMGRDHLAMCYIAKVTGANLIMSSGRYSAPSLTEEQKKMNADEAAAVIEDEFLNGVDGSGIKPGIIKCAINDLTNEIEMVSLRAGGRAQARIGAAINIHPTIWTLEDHDILDVLEEEGADLNRVILSHQDFTAEHVDYHDAVAKRGAYVEFDTFGCEAVAKIDEDVWFPSDGERINMVKRQIELGNVERLLISGDLCFKFCFKKWGGWGYEHIPKHIVSRMKKAGISDEDIHTITVENPRRVLAF
jgi:phosphotriesterase-related protein